MKKTDLIKQLLPGLAPLLIFFAVDAIWGTLPGIITAVAMGILWLAYIGIKDKKLDRLALLDTLLLTVLGGISIGFKNDLFFKLKPGFIGIIFCGLLAYAGFFSSAYIRGMTSRFMPEGKLNDQQIKLMQKNMQILFYLFGVHTLLVFYAALYMSKAAWAFISGGLFYILFGIYFLAEIMRTRVIPYYRYRNDEWVPVVSESGVVKGKAPRSIVHNGSMLLHPVVHVHIFNQRKMLYLQKRPFDKEIQPGKWDTAVGGHIAWGEDLKTAFERETFEETGLKLPFSTPIMTYIWESEKEREWINVFVQITNQSPVADGKEVEDGRFWSLKEIEQQIGKGIFTPNFEYEFEMLKKLLR